MYNIIIRPAAEKFLDKIPSIDFQKITEVILKLRNEPYPYGVEKLMDNIYRIRVGNYRVIYMVDEKNPLFFISNKTVVKLKEEIKTETLKFFINKEFSKDNLIKELKKSGFNSREIEKILEHGEKNINIDIGRIARRSESTYKEFKKLFKNLFFSK